MILSGFFIYLSYKNSTWDFDKLNFCLRDVQEWMSSSMLELNLEKSVFIFGSHAQLKKLDSYLLVRLFWKLVHISTVVKNLGN